MSGKRSERAEQDSSSPGGVAWFGNQYFDPNTGRWRKPRPGRSRPNFGSVFIILLVFVLLASTLCAFAGISPFLEAKNRVFGYLGYPVAHITEEGFHVYHNEQPPYLRGLRGGGRVYLINNDGATDPTWEELKSFLDADITDQRTYQESIFACGAFAEQVHNNAEAAGIRAAWVGVDFVGEQDGHALNAFLTTDQGLVFIDCTGGDSTFEVYAHDDFLWGQAGNWDRIAYIEVGKDYGQVSLGTDYGLGYLEYERWLQDKILFDCGFDDYEAKLEIYQAKQEAYLAQLAGRYYVSEYEYQGLQTQYEDLNRMYGDLIALLDRLDILGTELGAFWETLGVVKKVEIYW